jgi:2-methylcitrate dehydratase
VKCFSSDQDEHVVLAPDTNQVQGLAKYARSFLQDGEGNPSEQVLKRTNLFFTDAMLCGASAVALRTNAPTVLRKETRGYPLKSHFGGVPLMGSTYHSHPEKVIAANCASTREWDSNGTNFGYNPKLGHTAGEFGHPDFFPVCVAAAQSANKDGLYALKAMVLIEEIRCRLGEVFSLKSYKIDHVVHGAIASAIVYGTALGATIDEIESAVGMTVAHYVPFRAIRAGKQLSDSKGSSSAISTEAAIMSVRRSMNGFRGPKDIFRNPEAIFRLFEGPGQMLNTVGGGEPNLSGDDASPFLLSMGMSGNDFAVLGEHFKLGLYEQQSAGAIQGLLNLLEQNPSLMSENADGSKISNISITAYEPAFGIIGDPAKKDPTTRQSADHSMAYIISTLLRKAVQSGTTGWKELMLSPYDYSKDALYDPVTRSLMEKINFVHGGAEYDEKYPDGIPTSIAVTETSGSEHESGLIMYPAGHARNTEHDLEDILDHKFDMMSRIAFSEDEKEDAMAKLTNLADKTALEVKNMYHFNIDYKDDFKDA